MKQDNDIINAIEKTRVTKNLPRELYFRKHADRYYRELKIIEQYCRKDQKILEVGAIPYHMTYCLKNLGYDVSGVDAHIGEPEKEFMTTHGLNDRKCNIETDNIPFPDNSFDCILLFEVFEHLRIDPISTLKKLYSLLKEDGLLFLSTPNLYSFHTIIRFLMGKGFKDAYKEFSKLHTLGYTGHVREYTMTEVKRFILETGFRIVSAEFMFYKFYYPKNPPLAQVTNFIYPFLPPVWNRNIMIIAQKPSLTTSPGGSPA